MAYTPETVFVDKLPQICVNLELISVYDVACKSIPELLYLLSQKINATLTTVEHNDKALEAAVNELKVKLDAYIEAGLTDEVVDILDKLDKDGWFDAIIDERLDEKLGNLSESNVIAEIVRARDGFTTLGARVAKTGYVFDTIADLQAIIRDTPLADGTVVEVLGYYTAGDGAGHKRIIASVDDGSGVAVGNKFANIVHDKTKQLNAEIFSGTDSEKIQKAYDYLVENHKYGIIELSRKYVVDNSIMLKPTRYDALGITLKGGQIELATKFLFSSLANNNAREAVRVENITFTTTLTEDVYVYDCDNMIKPIITACNFEGVNCAYSTNYIQSVYISNSDIRNNGAFISAPTIFDGKIRGNRFEASFKTNAHVVKVFGTPTISYSIDNLVVTDNLIEGYVNTVPLILGSTKGLLVSGTYTEQNKGFIEFVNDGIDLYAGTIVDNFLNKPADDSPVFIKVAPGDHRLTITGNNGNWYGTHLTDANVTKCTIGSNTSLNGGNQSSGNRQPGRIMNEYDVRKSASPTLLRTGNFDTDRTTKIYRFDGTSQGTKPSGVAGGFIESVFTDEADWGYQKLYQTNNLNMYVRYFFGGSWTKWVKFTGVMES